MFLTNESTQQKLLKKGFTLITYELEDIKPVIKQRLPGENWKTLKDDFFNDGEIKKFKADLLKDENIIEVS